MLGLWKIIFQKKFDSEEWKRSTKHRKYYYKDISATSFIGSSKQEILELFGTKMSYGYENKWRYLLHWNKLNKKIWYLTFNFENDKVTNTKIAFKSKRKRI